MPFFLKHLKQDGFLDQLHMTVFNVGSRKISPRDDFATAGWRIFAPNLSIYGFDADADACDEANADLENREINWTEKHIPLAIADREGISTLYVTQHPMCSSLYPPNEPLLQRFRGLPELVNLDFEVELETTTLNAFCAEEKVNTIDFLQMDVQGAEIKVLEGATALLEQGILGIQTEVSFTELYVDQPLFCDVDRYLQDRNYALFHVSSATRVRGISPIFSTSRPGQILWGDAFYMLDLLSEKIDSAFRTPERLLKLACVADILDFPDYALEVLEYLTINYGEDSRFNVANCIVKSFTELPNFSENVEYYGLVFNRLKQYVSDECAKPYQAGVAG
jgi:FkbM family methyltransferase